MLSALSRTFDATADYCEVFQPYAGKGSVSVENDAFLATHKTAFGDPVDLQAYSDAINKFRDQRDDFPDHSQICRRLHFTSRFPSLEN